MVSEMEAWYTCASRFCTAPLCNCANLNELTARVAGNLGKRMKAFLNSGFVYHSLFYTVCFTLQLASVKELVGEKHGHETKLLQSENQ